MGLAREVRKVKALSFTAIRAQRDEHRQKAFDALGRYKFWMFGYHAAEWVNLNNLMPRRNRAPSPFGRLVSEARRLAALPDDAFADTGMNHDTEGTIE